MQLVHFGGVGLISIRIEEVSDHAAVRAINLAALEGGPEAGLVDTLRSSCRGLEVLRDQPYPFVVVLGHLEDYPRFGFERASASTRRSTKVNLIFKYSLISYLLPSRAGAASAPT